MPDNEVALRECYDELSKEFPIELVDYIPDGIDQRKIDVPVWKISIIAEVFGKVDTVEAYMAFPREFPYLMPYVVVPEERFSLLPHISVASRKLCLYEDSVVYDTENIVGLIRDCISKTRKWLELYSNQDNTEEYTKEIDSYWNEQYEGETEVESHWILLGQMPNESCELQGYLYSVDFLGEKGKYFDQCVVCGADVFENILNNIKTKYSAHKITVQYIKSMKIPSMPPYSIKGSQLLERIENEDDKNRFTKFINKNLEGYFLFPLGLDYILGGVIIPKQKVINRSGYRNGYLRATDILTKYESKNKKFGRIKVGLYEETRMAKRTAGQLMKHQNFVVAGLGSVGSNLCYYLNGYNNASFALVDPDNLTIDNIGRHLLGFNYIDQRKVHAVADYLNQYRPDREVKPIAKRIELIPVDGFYQASAIFLCTGDIMSEKWLLNKMQNKEITQPTFFLWLEPYGISGIMIYVVPDDTESIIALRTEANDRFMKYCLIEHTEYERGDKLTKHDAGCNGNYALYSANDVTLFLSAMFPQIDRLLDNPDKTQIIQWVGNVEIANQREINLVERADGLSKGQVLNLNL